MHFVLLQEIELTEKAQKEDQEFEELVAFIQQRLTQTEVTYFCPDSWNIQTHNKKYETNLN